MGVKDLWTVLEPISEHCTMSDLRGKVLAVDISGWIFQSLQSPVMQHKQSMRPHVRNLFWRLHHLTRNEVRIVVVFDGPSPKLKSVALAKRAIARRQQREKDQPEEEPALESMLLEPKAFRPMNVGTESYFGQYCNECKEMLRAFRIPYVVSSGDAEATCAYLNRLGLVDGCITDDNDAFLFGASIVYRHYTCDKKKLENMKRYRSVEIEEQLGLTQDHLIAMALILGCDYGLVGIKGIGKERALEVMQSWPGCNPLQKMRDWRTDKSLDTLARFDQSNKPEHCKFCGHLGNNSDHRSEGCNGCARLGRGCARVPSEEWVCNCEWHKQFASFKKQQTEVKIRKAAMEDASFPDSDIIETYKLAEPDEHPGDFVWTRPYYGEVQMFISRVFGWNKQKAREKLLTYFTAYDLMALKNGFRSYELSSQPERVISKRIENGREFFEVEWKSIPDLPQFGGINTPDVIITRECKDLFMEVFPELVEQYELSKEEAKKAKKKSKKQETPDDGTEADTCSQTPKRAGRPKKAGEAEEQAEETDIDGLQKKPKRGRKKKNDDQQRETGDGDDTKVDGDKMKAKPKRGRKSKVVDDNEKEEGECSGGFLAKTLSKGLLRKAEKQEDRVETLNEFDNLNLGGVEQKATGSSADSDITCCKTPARKRKSGDEDEGAEADLIDLTVCKTPRKKKRVTKPAISVQETPLTLTSDQQLTVECFFIPARRALNFDIDGASNNLEKERFADTSLAQPICISDEESETPRPRAAEVSVETSSAEKCYSAQVCIQRIDDMDTDSFCIQQEKQTSIERSDSMYCHPSIKNSEPGLRLCCSAVENTLVVERPTEL